MSEGNGAAYQVSVLRTWPAKGERMTMERVPVSSADDLDAVLRDALLWTPGLFDDDHKAASAYQGGAPLFVLDLDLGYGHDHTKVPMPDDLAHTLGRMVERGDLDALGVVRGHDTPHGFRLVVRLERGPSSADEHAAVFDALAPMADEVMQQAALPIPRGCRLRVDRCTRAASQGAYGALAYVDGTQRGGTLYVSDSSPARFAVPRVNAAPKAREALPQDDLLRRAFDRERGSSDGQAHQECPLCGSDTGFHQHEDGRWTCYSTNHGPRLAAAGVNVGQVKDDGSGYGDSTDLAAHAAGMPLVGYLHQQGHTTHAGGRVNVTPKTTNDDQEQARPVLLDLDDVYQDVRSGKDDGVLVNNLLKRGRITNVAAPPKAGKSTWLLHALCCFAAPTARELPGYGKPEHPLRTLYLSENHPEEDAVMHAAFNPRQEYGRGVRGRVVMPDRTSMPEVETWDGLLDYVAAQCEREAFDVVVFDTLEQWVPDLEDGNAAAQVSRLFKRAGDRLALRCNVAVVFVLHMRKDTAHGALSFDAILGSVKNRGGADMNVIMERVSPDSETDTRVVVRREGRDPWGTIARLCGRIPRMDNTVLVGRKHDAPRTTCYRMVGQVKTDDDGQEYAHAWYQAEDLPEQYGPTGGKRKMKRGAARSKADAEVLRRAFVLRAREKGNTPVSERSLVDYLVRAVEQWHDKPDAYDLPEPTSRRVQAAARTLVERGVLLNSKDGKVLADDALETDR